MEKKSLHDILSCTRSECAIFLLYHGENKLIFNEMMMRYVLYQTNTLIVGFLQCQFTETTVHGQTCRSTRTHYSDSEPTSICSFSLMLRAQWRSNKYQFYSLWFDPNPRLTALEASTVTITTPLTHQSFIFIDRYRHFNKKWRCYSSFMLMYLFYCLILNFYYLKTFKFE